MAVAASHRQEPRKSDSVQRTRTQVVGFDGSDESRAALRAAIERAGPDDRITVVHAYPTPPSWMADPYFHQAVRENEQEARRVLAEAAHIADDSPAEVSLEMHEGPPAVVLDQVATLREADEIVVGTRGLGRLRAAIGSVAQGLVRTVERPVLIVPAKPA